MSADKRPKGILKASTSFDKEGQHVPKDKEMKWDEMNILATYHPADKDYGHVKIDEPPTPYNRLSESEGDAHSGDEDNVFDPQRLASSLATGSGKPKVMTKSESSEGEDDDENMTEEEKAKKAEFRKRRQLHYNEFQAVKLARQLLESEDDDEENDDVKNGAENVASHSNDQSYSDMVVADDTIPPPQSTSEMDTTEQTADCSELKF